MCVLGYTQLSVESVATIEQIINVTHCLSQYEFKVKENN